MNLENLQLPNDLHNLSNVQLHLLADDIRDRIIDVLSTNSCGGHLSSNLGIVEITIAMHKVFQSPKDRFIFDTSHQTYVHKILTGRNDQLETIRQIDGLCGFSSPLESEHDHFFAGHAGTALSLALGVAKSRDMSNEDFHVMAVLGDAALTCGLTLEALNNIPKDLKNFTVVLNDNNMSISPSVGTINDLLNNVHHRNYIKEFFSNFGFNYIGVIDGHDLDETINTFSNAKNQNAPTLLHFKTVKGKGMDLAMEKPTVYHGVKPFDTSTGEFIKPSTPILKFPQIYGRHLHSLAKENEQIIAITPAMPAGSCLSSMMKEFPERCIDVGIAEGHSVTYAGALAKSRKQKVFATIYATFLQRALDNLFQDVCLQNSPVIFGLDRGGIAGPDGATHNGIYDLGFLCSMPNMIVTQPRDGHLLKELMNSALTWDQPCAIRYPNLPTVELESPLLERTIGKAEILSPGKDVVLISLGHKNYDALLIKENLKEYGIDATVVDPIFLKPLDTELFYKIFLSHKFVFTIEEHCISSGLASVLNSFITQEGIQGLQVQNFGVGEEYVHHGSHADVSKHLGIDVESITNKILRSLAITTNVS